MAAPIPTALRTADIARFALRAGQLEKMKPVIAYWCKYWMVNQILSKNLHNSDDECMTYTMRLMDKLEQVKAEQSENDAIIDDLAGKAYVEQFGLETLERAENAMNQNRVSRQTVDTLHASATFLELCQIWGPLEPEVASKIKFAKYHAVRIARALKAGEDPNLSNPTVDLSAIQEQSQVLSDDAESPVSPGTKGIENQNQAARQPFVEDLPDEHENLEPHVAQKSLTRHFLPPAGDPSNIRPQNQDITSSRSTIPPETGDYYNSLPTGDISPLGPPWTNYNQSDGGGYFPRDAHSENGDPLSLPEIPSENPKVQPLNSAGTSPQPSARYYSPSPDRPQSSSLESFPPPIVDQPRAPEPPRARVATNAPQHFSAPRDHSIYPLHPPFQQSPPKMQDQVAPGSHAGGQSQMPIQPTYVTDEEAIMAAQKHARWAISALNFEDVKTAVKELKSALEVLGVR